MREILFRGKDVSFGDWIEGDLIRNDNRCYPAVFIGCIEASQNRYDELSIDGHYLPKVDPETVGQYTGLKDKNGKRIFEGDVVRIGSGIFEFTGCVVFEQGCFQLVDPECDVYECLWYQSEEMTVLGNIHDNPELLEAEGMKKLFISQPMNGYSDAEIKEKRGEAITKAALKLRSGVKVIDSFFEGVDHYEKPMWYLGESIKKLAEADAAYFVKGWQNSRGCRIEHEAAVAYGIEVIYE